jgi:hypothetical protein
VDRQWNQLAVDAVYRFLADEKLYVGGRYNTAEGTLAGIANEVSVDRVQVGAGWFLTPSLLLKAEWMKQDYNDFPTTDIRRKGMFKGMIFEAIVSF